MLHFPLRSAPFGDGSFPGGVQAIIGSGNSFTPALEIIVQQPKQPSEAMYLGMLQCLYAFHHFINKRALNSIINANPHNTFLVSFTYFLFTCPTIHTAYISINNGQ